MDDNKEMVELLKQSQSLISKLSETIKDMAPMAQFAEYVIADDKNYSMKEAADIITDRLLPVKLGRNNLFKTLREIGILCASDSAYNQPYRKFIDAEYFVTKLKETNVGIKTVTLVTGNGLNFIYTKVSEYLGC